MNASPASEQSALTLSNLVALASEIMLEVMGVDSSDTIGGKVIDHDTMAGLVSATALRELQPLLQGKSN